MVNPQTKFSSTWIVAQQDSGKTYLLKSMILGDLQTDCSIIVMDSKGELTKFVRSLALGDRLIVIDPDEPVALNPLDVEGSSDEIISNLTYMMSGLLEVNISQR